MHADESKGSESIVSVKTVTILSWLYPRASGVICVQYKGLLLSSKALPNDSKDFGLTNPFHPLHTCKKNGILIKSASINFYLGVQ